MLSTPFLKEVAAIILNRELREPGSVCLIFPNKRARLYMSRYIGELTDTPVWAPRYFTINELMEKISGYQVADRITLLFELYASYVKITGSNENFDSFYPYSETLLADFDEVDKYLVDAGDIFRNLSDLKLMDGKFNYLTDKQLEYIRRFWSAFADNRPGESKSVFISLWESLPGIYNEYRSRLINRNLAYEGMAYRKAAERPDACGEIFGANTRFVFTGFNALSAAEEKLFIYLKKTGKADFYWDYDLSYLDPVHEAGTFIRRNISLFPENKVIFHDHWQRDKQKIVFVPVYSNSGQAEIISEVMDKLEIRETASYEKTALVLADESLLITTLYALPGKIKDINVTMGYPLNGSAVFSLVDSLYELHRNSGKSQSGKISWYFADIMAIMNNPLLKKRYAGIIEKIRKKALDEHRVYLTMEDLSEAGPDDVIFSQDSSDTLDFLLEVITVIIRDLPSGKAKPEADPVRAETLFSVFTTLTRVRDVVREQRIQPGTDVVFRLIRKMLRNMRVPFSGEPLAGLQILGLLETRTLDFDNVILLSVNEGILPGNSDKPSFIPYDLRAGFGMPTPEHHDAIYAYYFYRLLQRAGNIALIYDASSGGMKTGERSRFLHQLHYDMKLNIEELQVGSTVSRWPVKEVVIDKKGDVLKKLYGYLGEKAKSLSPSAINEYLNCTLKFYFHHLAELPQPEELSDEVDARMFGNLIHNALCSIYSRFGAEVVTAGRIAEVLVDETYLYEVIDRAFCEELFNDKDGSSGRKPEGYNLLVRQVLFSYIKQFLITEKESAPFTIQSLEGKHYISVPVRVNGTETEIKTGGIIDRVDLKDGRIRILDYKTGNAKNAVSSVDSLFDRGEKNRNDAVFQVLLYSLVYRKNYPDADITPGLFFLRDCFSEKFSPAIEIGTRKEKRILDDFGSVSEEYEQQLNKTFEELFNKEIPFEQTGNLKICKYCAYAGICRR